MSKPLKRRKRLPDGSLGPLEIIFEGDTEEVVDNQEVQELRAEVEELKQALDALLGVDKDE